LIGLNNSNRIKHLVKQKIAEKRYMTNWILLLNKSTTFLLISK